MMDAFFTQELLPRLAGLEGGYTNNPSDSGGETNHGVTVGVAREWGYLGRMRDMTVGQAQEIYAKRFYVTPGFDKLALVNRSVTAELFDTGVNMGPAVGIEFLQIALNGLNRREKDYPDMPVDGELGPTTRSALGTFLKLRGKAGETVMLKLLNAQQDVRYLTLTSRKQNEDFLFGWVLQRG